MNLDDRDPSLLKAYEDFDFLKREELRPVRLMLELMKPELRLREHKIDSTVVVFGSTRVVPEKEMKPIVAGLALGERIRAIPGDLAFDLPGAAEQIRAFVPRRYVVLGWITSSAVILLGIGFGFVTKDVHSVTKWITSSLIPAFVVPNVLKWHWWRFNGYGFFAGMAAGTAAGGWRIIKTMGQKICKLQPVHGFTAQTTAAAIIEGASHFGIPLSTTHVISSSIMGVT